VRLYTTVAAVYDAVQGVVQSSEWANSEVGLFAHSAPNQGLTLVHLSAQRKRFLRDKGYLGGV